MSEKVTVKVERSVLHLPAIALRAIRPVTVAAMLMVPFRSAKALFSHALLLDASERSTTGVMLGWLSVER